MPVPQDIQRFGNHLIVGVSGTKLSDEDKRALSELQPIGVIFFGKNFQDGIAYEFWLQSFKALIDEVREYAERDSIFITIDHEGGRVVRPPAPITRFPYASFYGSRSREIAKATALELKSLGINVSWAPVADIYSHPENAVIGPRAFGNTPEIVAQLASEYYLGLKESGILGCVKHFPGHGDTTQDSHIELPTLNLTIEDLRNRELIPFKALIEADVPLVMTAHILFPRIDPHVPATLSQPILNGILREELGFKGVVVSDDLEMKAISDIFIQSGTVARAFHAGCDLFIVSRNINSSSIERTYQIAQDFAESLNNGSLKESVVTAAKERIEKLLAVTPQYIVHTLDQDILLEHAQLAIASSYQEVGL